MFDRRMVTDLALAALIAFPAVLPASNSLVSADSRIAPPPAAARLASAEPVRSAADLRGRP